MKTGPFSAEASCHDRSSHPSMSSANMALSAHGKAVPPIRTLSWMTARPASGIDANPLLCRVSINVLLPEPGPPVTTNIRSRMCHPCFPMQGRTRRQPAMLVAPDARSCKLASSARASNGLLRICPSGGSAGPSGHSLHLQLWHPYMRQIRSQDDKAARWRCSMRSMASGKADIFNRSSRTRIRRDGRGNGSHNPASAAAR